MAEITPEGIARFHAGQESRQTPARLYAVSTPPQGATRAPVAVVVNEHSRRFPRTLRDAFKQSEGYRHAAGRVDESGAMIVEDEPPALGLRALITPDRVCWAIIIALGLWVVRWAWLAPKVGT